MRLLPAAKLTARYVGRLRAVTKDIQRKIKSLFGAFLNLCCLRLPVILSAPMTPHTRNLIAILMLVLAAALHRAVALCPSRDDG